MAATDTLPEQAPKPLVGGDRPPGALADRVFRGLALGAGLLVLVILGLIIYEMTNQSLPWFRAEGFNAIFSDNWVPSAGHYGALGLVVGTLVVGAIALIIAVPVSVGIALFVTEVAHRRVRRPIVYMIDLLAAVPSVVFGLWALRALEAPLANVYTSVSDALSGVPIFGALTANPNPSGASFMTAGIVVAIMITPIITAITREVYATCPPAQKEAALALGATRWEMIRGSVFPHSRSGVTAAVIIGFGRAVGETIAVALVIGSSPRLTEQIFGPGDTMASVIVNSFGEATGTERAALIGLGVVLLGVTVVIGVLARTVLARRQRRLGVV
jgi:phosphate transport system permease protein